MPTTHPTRPTVLPSTPITGADRDVSERRARRAWQEHGGAVVGYAASLLGGDEHAAQDVAQEVMLRLWQHPDVDDGARSLRGWLFTVTRRLVVDRHRRRLARPTEVPEFAVESSPAGAADTAEAGVLGAIAVHELLRDLVPAHRSAVFLVHARGWSVTQAARALGVPSGTVKSRCHYALRHLRETAAEHRAAEHAA